MASSWTAAGAATSVESAGCAALVGSSRHVAVVDRRRAWLCQKRQSCCCWLTTTAGRRRGQQFSIRNAWKRRSRLSLKGTLPCQASLGHHAAESPSPAFSIESLLAWPLDNLEETVLPRISKRVWIASGIALLVATCYTEADIGSIDSTGHTVLGTLLSFFTVFRSQQAYSRFWEGRSHLGAVVGSLADFSSKASSFIQGRGERQTLARLEFARRLRLFFRAFVVFLLAKSDTMNISTAEYEEASLAEVAALRASSAPHMTAMGWLQQYALEVGIKQQLFHGDYSDMRMQTMMLENTISAMIPALQGSAKIATTPFPPLYAHIGTLLMNLLVYTFPCALVSKMEWLTIPVETLLAMSYFGLNETAVQIENPFGTDVTDFFKDDTFTRQVNGIINNSLKPHDLSESDHYVAADLGVWPVYVNPILNNK
eukprot:jgi/Chlat1/4606/Chrsp290S04357